MQERGKSIKELVVKYRTAYDYKPPVGLEVRNPESIAEAFKDMAEESQEVLTALFLNGRNVLQSFRRVHTGAVTESLADPGVILRDCLLAGCVGLVVMHNHPSGNTRPSVQDKRVAEHLEKACEYLNIKLIDFMIIGDEGQFYSFAEGGLLN